MMGLTAEVELSLRDTSLIRLFEDNEVAFRELAQASYDYAAGYVSRIGLPIRRDDVAKTLIPALVTNELLRESLADKKLRQQYWYRNFGDLILDRLWEELTGEPEGSAG